MDHTESDRSAGPTGEHRSIWIETSPETSYEALEDGVRVDTAIVGGGIVGVTTASRLAEAGQSVAIVERDRILTGVTGHTTAKLTSLHGLIYARLLEEFGLERARQYAEANEAAIDEVERTVEAHDLDCDFARTPAYTYVESTGEREAVRDEVDAAKRLDLPASYTESTDLPYDVAAAVRFDDQAHFHPRKYLLALAERVPGDGSYVFEETRAVDVTRGEPLRVDTDRGTVRADDVVIASHFPFFDHALYFARLSPKRSYVLAARLGEEPPEGMYYRPGDSYFSVRPRPTGEAPVALLGGQNHRTGHGGGTTERYRKLEREARDRFDVESIEYRWSTQDYVSVDGVPFVGTHAPGAKHVYVATGFGGWGMTNGTAAGMLLSDLVLDRENPWREVFKPSRLAVGASTRRLIDHNSQAMRHYFEDRLTSPPRMDLSDLDPGDARVVEVDDETMGVYRDEDGELHAVSAICTHMGCEVEWNDGERSWDCPCHGSRFDYDGAVLDTPAVDNLGTYDDEDLSRLGVEQEE